MADPEIMEMIESAIRSWQMPEPPADIDLTDHLLGDCADCGKPSPVLRSFGESKRPLCPTCLGARLRVAAKIGQP